MRPEGWVAGAPRSTWGSAAQRSALVMPVEEAGRDVLADAREWRLLSVAGRRYAEVGWAPRVARRLGRLPHHLLLRARRRCLYVHPVLSHQLPRFGAFEMWPGPHHVHQMPHEN